MRSYQISEAPRLIAEIMQKFHLPIEMTGESQFFASHNNDFTTLQKVFGNYWCKSTNEVATTVDDYCLQFHTRIKDNLLEVIEVMFVIEQECDFCTTFQCEKKKLTKLHKNNFIEKMKFFSKIIFCSIGFLVTSTLWIRIALHSTLHTRVRHCHFQYSTPLYRIFFIKLCIIFHFLHLLGDYCTFFHRFKNNLHNFSVFLWFFSALTLLFKPGMFTTKYKKNGR